MHFIADTDTDENVLEFIFGSRYRDSCSLQPGGGAQQIKIVLDKIFIS